MSLNVEIDILIWNDDKSHNYKIKVTITTKCQLWDIKQKYDFKSWIYDKVII